MMGVPVNMSWGTRGLGWIIILMTTHVQCTFNVKVAELANG